MDLRQRYGKLYEQIEAVAAKKGDLTPFLTAYPVASREILAELRGSKKLLLEDGPPTGKPITEDDQTGGDQARQVALVEDGLQRDEYQASRYTTEAKKLTETEPTDPESLTDDERRELLIEREADHLLQVQARRAGGTAREAGFLAHLEGTGRV